MLTSEEKLELAKLLEYRTRSSFEIRRQRCIAADMRLGMWENGRFVGHGLAELVGKARHGKVSLPKMLRGANAFKISDQQPRFRANPATECNNATCPAAREITIRQPQAFPCNVRSLSSTVTQKPTRAFSIKISFTELARADGCKSLHDLPVSSLRARNFFA
jgi:hypothetical protein